MVSHISRTKRWWKFASKLDPKILMSDVVIGSLLLGHAGRSPSENMMALTSRGHVATFDNIKDALILQHGRVHTRPKSKGESGEGSSFDVDAAQTQLPEHEQGQG
eukprot:328604-Pyramimonas_sp.AAC.1